MPTVAHADNAALIPSLPRGGSIERWLVVIALLGMVALPMLELLGRGIGVSIPGTIELTQLLCLWVGFLGAVLATEARQHLALVFQQRTDAVAAAPMKPWLATLATAITLCLAWASFRFVAAEMPSPARIGGWLPVAAGAAILPIAFSAMVLRFAWHAGDLRARFGTLAIAALAVLPLVFLDELPHAMTWPLVAGLVMAGLLGLPIFLVLGGTALVLLFADGVPAAALPVETYRLVVSPTIPAIPLFTLTGFILASGGAARRLVRLFQAWFGPLPGGTVVAVTLVCAFFSAFTGASGVTILALGGLLLPALIGTGHREPLAVGLITATGSIGLLFPPSLAVILYGVVANVPIPDLFRAGVLPGVVMVAAVACFGVISTRQRAPVRFDSREARNALWDARYELLLPILVLVAMFGGFASLIEAAAMTACYALLVEGVLRREPGFWDQLPGMLVRCTTLLGGVFAIIGVAMGLTNYLVDAMVPMQLVDWVEANVSSKVAFLLAINVLLLVVGCLMDIYSAIFVVLPLIIPASKLFGIDPLHLGIIFLINLEIGYLTPPVGMNLFLAAYRLGRPVLTIYRSVWPFLAVLVLVLLLVTFVPGLIIRG